MGRLCPRGSELAQQGALRQGGGGGGPGPGCSQQFEPGRRPRSDHRFRGSRQRHHGHPPGSLHHSRPRARSPDAAARKSGRPPRSHVLVRVDRRHLEHHHGFRLFHLSEATGAYHRGAGQPGPAVPAGARLPGWLRPEQRVRGPHRGAGLRTGGLGHGAARLAAPAAAAGTRAGSLAEKNLSSPPTITVWRGSASREC